MKSQEERISDTLGDIASFYQELNRCKKCTDYEFLESSIQRREQVKKATNYNDSVDFIIPFNALNAENEL